MDIKRTDITDTSVELTVTASEEQLKEYKQHTLKKLQPEVDAPGFRKGKVPLNQVEKQLKSDYLQAQFLDEAIGHLYGDAVLDQKLRVLEQPKIEIQSFVPYTQLVFLATVSVVPPVKLGTYPKNKSISKVSVSAKDVDEVLDNLRTRSAEKKAVERVAQQEDEVWIDFSGVDADGKAVAGASGTDYPLQLGSDTFIPGFEPELIGLKKGDEKTFTITFPKDYAHKPLAAQKVDFTVTVKDVKEVVRPEISDKLAAQLGPFKTVAELKADIKKQVTQQKEQEALTAVKDEIVGELVEASTVVVPEVLLNDQIQSLKEDFTRNLTYRGVTLPEYLNQNSMTEEEFIAQEISPKAERRVQAGLVLAEVADAEEIGITKEELDIRIALLKGQNQQQAAQFDSDDARRDTASRLLTEKTVDFLLDHASKPVDKKK